MWVVDVVRIVLIFAAGAEYGEGFAVDTLHPVVGLVGVSLAVLAMIRAVPVFGLRLVVPRLRIRRSTPAPSGPRASRAVPRAGVALGLVAAVAGLATVANAGMQRYLLLAEDLGPPRIVSATVARAPVSGRLISWMSHFPWATTYFGTDATWDRYVYAPSPDRLTGPGLSAPVFLDLISTSDLLTFSTYGLDACYRFHNYDVLDSETVDLGGGLIGHEVLYHLRPGDSAWTAVYWEWPVNTPSGDRYERIILSVSTSYDDRSAAATQQDMSAFARSIVTASAALAATAPGATT
jgi:hypothetical protein